MIFNQFIGIKRTAIVTLYGALSEDVTLTPVGGTALAPVTLNAHGISDTTVEIPLGIYTVVGSVSSEILPNGRMVIVDKTTTEVKAYPDGAIFWFGNGGTDGDSLFSVMGGWTKTKGHKPSGKSGDGGADSYHTGAYKDGYVYAGVNPPASSTKHATSGYSKNTISCAGYSYVNVYARGTNTSRTGIGFPPKSAASWSTSIYSNITSTSKQLYSMEIPSDRTEGRLAASAFNASNQSGATAYIYAAWFDDKEATPIGEQKAGTHSINVLSNTYRYMSSSGAWAKAGNVSTDNYVGTKDGIYNSALIPVGSYSFTGTSTRLRLSFYGYCPSVDFYVDGFRWAICTSDANKALYQGCDAVTTDDSQVATGIATLAYNNGVYKTYEIDLKSEAIPANTPLYVYFWSKDDSTGVAHFRSTLTATMYYEAEQT